MTIGKYRLEAEIGHGAFGRVYRAYDPATKRTVAIKTLISGKNNKDVLARFRREATATANLKHKNIVIVYEYGEYEETPYLVMEYLEGEDLKSALSSERNFTLLEKTSIISQLAEGLQYAHQRGIVHRDIKPANLMILAEGTVKIMDFGIVRVLNEVTTRLTRHGDVIGTLSYVAPEVFQGAEVDQRCDVFSCGAICYEMIAGRHPFTADDATRIIYNITSTQPPPVTTFVPDCPVALEQLIARALHKDPELRYQSIEDLLFDLMPIRLQLQSVEAQNLLRKAETLVQGRQVREAQTVIRQVLQLDPNNTSARQLRERVNREIQQEVAQDRCDQLIVRGTEELNSSQYQKARETFEAALALVAENVQAQNLLDQVKVIIKKRERADALIARARAELEADQLTDAYRSILESFQYAPDDKEATRLLEMIRAGIKVRERQRRLTEGLAKAEELIRNGQPDDAESVLADLEVSYPTAHKVKQLMNEVASLIAEKRRRQQLLQDLETVRGILSEKKWADALERLSTILLMFPDDHDAQSLYAHAQEQLQLQRTAEHVGRILRDAHTANEGRDFDRALSLLNDGLRKYPGESSLESMLTRTSELQREYQRRIAIRAATERATELAANDDFEAALGVIDLTASTWESRELQDLRSNLQKRKEAFEKAKALANAIAAVKLHLERQEFVEAVKAGQKALSVFPEQPELNLLVTTAEKRLARQRREARIKAIRDQAATSAAQGLFEDALKLLRNGSAELGDDPSLSALYDRIELQLNEQQRQQEISALAASLQEAISQRDYQAAVNAGRAGLRKFPGESSLTELLETAERSLLQQQRTQQIAKIKEEAQSLAASQQFLPALKLIRNGIQELGPDPSLQELEQSVESLRRKYERQRAIDAALSRARQVLASKDFAGAVALLEQTLKQYPGETPVENLLADARGQLSQQQRSNAIAAVLQKARELVRAREFQSALDAIRSALKAYPDESSLAETAAQIRADMQEAEKQRAIRAALETTAALRDRGEFTKAAQLLDQALLQAPNHPELLLQLSTIKEKIATQQKVNVVLDEVFELLSREAFDVALERVHRALAAFPGELALSSLLEEVKKAQRSQAILEVCREIEALVSSVKLISANERCDQALAAFPRDPNLITLQRRIRSEIAETKKREMVAALTVEIRQLLGQQRVDDAIPKLEKALKEFPGDTELSALLAYSNEVLAARRRTDDVNELAKRARNLLRNSKPQEAETLLKDALRRYPDEEAFFPLLKHAQDAASQEEKPPLIETIAPPQMAEATGITEAPRPREVPHGRFGRVRHPEKLVGVYRKWIWLVLLIAIGLVGWAIFPRITNFFGSKHDLAQDLLISARDAEKRKNVDALVAELTKQQKQNQDDQSLETVGKILDLDPSNQAAISVRDEIQKRRFAQKTQKEQDQYVNDTLAAAQQLFRDGNLEEARTKIEEVLLLRRNHRTAIDLRRQIANQLVTVAKMASERSRMEQTRDNAEKAGAPAFDQAGFTQAQRVEESARRLESGKQFDEASKRFTEAADLYRSSENAARAEIQSRAAATQVQRNQSEASRADYEQSRAKARAAGAEEKAGPTFRAAFQQGVDGQNRFDRGDFTGARGQFDAASKGMLLAADEAAAAYQAAEAAVQRTALDAARNEMENTKRGFSGTDAQASEEENRARQLAQAGKLVDATTAYQRASSLWRDAIVKDAQKKDAAQKEDNERRAIRAVLDQYRDAYQARDMNAVRRVFPGITGDAEKQVIAMFNDARSVQLSLELNMNAIQIAGDAAKLTTKASLQVVYRGDNRTFPAVGTSIFDFRKSNGTWVIQNITRF